MKSVYKVSALGFEFYKDKFSTNETYKKAISILRNLDASLDSNIDPLVLSFDLLYLYTSELCQSNDMNALLFNLSIPKYDKIRFEILHEGKLDSKSFRFRIKTFNARDEQTELENTVGDFYQDKKDGKEYFLSPPQSHFLNSWKIFHTSLNSIEFQKNIQFRLEEYEKLVNAYEKLEIKGTSILDTLKIKLVDNFQYNLLGNEDGSLDIIPSFESDLEIYNQNLNVLAETSTQFGSRISLKDRVNKKNVQIIFTKKGEEAWHNFYKMKQLSPTERTSKLKNSDFLELYPPKDIIGDIFSNRVIGFVLDSPQKIVRDNQSAESWSDGFDDISNTLTSTSGSSYAISLTPSPSVYIEIRSTIQDFQIRLQIEEERLRRETGAILSEPDLSKKTIYIDSLKDEFSLIELETLAERIEKANKPDIAEDEIENANNLIIEAKEQKHEMVSWRNSEGQDQLIPRRSLERGLKDQKLSDKTHHTVGVKLEETRNICNSEDIVFNNDWFMQNVDFESLKMSDAFKPDISLRQHQAYGYAWLSGISSSFNVLEKCKSRGALLADDMGLGKTIQVIRLLVDYKSAKEFKDKPILIVAPLSLLETSWKVDGFKAFLNEDFLNTNKIINIHDVPSAIPKHIAIKEIIRIEEELSVDPQKNFGSIELSPILQQYINSFKLNIGASIVLCSYETLRSRILEIGSVDFSLVILDEAQKIKNKDTGQSNAAKALKANMKVAMTGTPIENAITDLWNICDFVVPGYLGTIKDFKDSYQKPIAEASPGTPERKVLAQNLENRLKPIWLRRTKKEVLKSGEIPPIIHYDSIKNHDGMPQNQHLLQMSDDQYQIFESQVGYFNESKAGHKLAAIRNMMEACYAPWWTKGLKADYSNIKELYALTPKLKITFEILNQIALNQEKVIIFANIKDLQRELAWLIHQWYFYNFSKSVDCEVFNGDSSLDIRGAILARFKNAQGFKAVVISPRSGGAGLNIVEANHVIHYTREWNPAVERQATDRAHRLGQTKVVHVYYPTSSLMHLGKISAEEHLANILREKREIIDDFTVSQGDLGNNEEQFGSYDFSTEDTRLSPEGIRTLGPYRFEKLVAKYFESQGYKVEVVGQAGDHGCDIVCLGIDKSALVQVKFSESNNPQGTKPINEIRGSRSFYEKKYNRKFTLMAVTNTVFSPNAWNLAINGDHVELISGDVLNIFLEKNLVKLSSLK